MKLFSPTRQHCLFSALLNENMVLSLLSALMKPGNTGWMDRGEGGSKAGGCKKAKLWSVVLVNKDCAPFLRIYFFKFIVGFDELPFLVREWSLGLQDFLPIKSEVFCF